MYPAGSRICLGGGFISPSFSLTVVLDAVVLCDPRLLDRFSISALASVVSDGSPGSSLLIDGAAVGMPLCAVLVKVVSPVRVLARFTDGAPEEAVSAKAEDFLFFPADVSPTVDSSPSSPDASREDGCR